MAAKMPANLPTSKGGGRHAGDALVGRPEGLAQADGVVYDLGDGGIPVAALAVVEDAVPADHELVGVAGGEGGGDALFFGTPHAVAIDETNAGQGGQRRVASGVVHGDAQFAGAAVQVEGADLEGGLALAGVEVAEGDEVVGQRQQVAHVAGEALEFARAIAFAGGVGLGGEPGGVGGELVLEGLPVGFGECFAVAQQGRHGCVTQDGDATGPSRVDARTQG